jgi:hypothetical protein
VIGEKEILVETFCPLLDDSIRMGEPNGGGVIKTEGIVGVCGEGGSICDCDDFDIIPVGLDKDKHVTGDNAVGGFKKLRFCTCKGEYGVGKNVTCSGVEDEGTNRYWLGFDSGSGEPDEG